MMTKAKAAAIYLPLLHAVPSHWYCKVMFPSSHLSGFILSYINRITRTNRTQLKAKRIETRNRNSSLIIMVSFSNSSSSSQRKKTSSFALHSVAKPQADKKQASSQPLEPRLSSRQPRVYKVKPIHFRELVQHLTGAPHLQQPSPDPIPSRLQGTAPPPLPIAHRVTSAASPPGGGGGSGIAKSVEKSVDQEGGLPNEILLSPNFRAWCNSFPALLSPGTSQLWSA